MYKNYTTSDKVTLTNGDESPPNPEFDQKKQKRRRRSSSKTKRPSIVRKSERVTMCVRVYALSLLSSNSAGRVFVRVHVCIYIFVYALDHLYAYTNVCTC